MNKDNSIDTHYKDYKFRSRLEARWAVFFDQTEVDYIYEHEGFELASGNWYLPDFYLRNVGLRSTNANGVWAEIKGVLSNEYWNTDVIQKLRELVVLTSKPAVLLVGDPDWRENYHWGKGSDIIEVSYHETSDQNSGAAATDWPMEFVKCEDCGELKFEFSESNYMICESCGGHCSRSHKNIKKAVQKAKSARFEFGESP